MNVMGSNQENIFFEFANRMPYWVIQNGDVLCWRPKKEKIMLVFFQIMSKKNFIPLSFYCHLVP